MNISVERRDEKVKYKLILLFSVRFLKKRYTYFRTELERRLYYFKTTLRSHFNENLYIYEHRLSKVINECFLLLEEFSSK